MPHKNGCFNRAPLKDQVLYGMDSMTGKVICIELPHRMSTECRYSQFDRYADQGCVGCIHKKEPNFEKTTV
jgi:hypothetical protein